MAHNVTAMRFVDSGATQPGNLAVADEGTRMRYRDASHDGEVIADYPVLTICDGEGREASIYVRGPEASSPALVLNPWTSEAVIITGEDLFALREIMNELPESAFRVPAPATKVPQWIEGDRVIASNSDGKNAWLYVRGPVNWAPGVAITPSASDGSMPMSDAAMDEYVTHGGHDVFTVIIKNGKKVKA